MINKTINGNSTVKINAELITKTDKAILLNCEGDEVWFPLSKVEYNEDKTVYIEEWLYDKLIEEGKL